MLYTRETGYLTGGGNVLCGTVPCGSWWHNVEHRRQPYVSTARLTIRHVEPVTLRLGGVERGFPTLAALDDYLRALPMPSRDAAAYLRALGRED